uniref:Vasohibin 1 n=2 Tax=Echinococcus granulosus TaxID=6210 RepID=A0A068WPM3_ECHGR|nr:vasohibin 1 [Echinococcus granulosus]
MEVSSIPGDKKRRFLVNSGGFPLGQSTWARMLQFCIDCYPNLEQKVLDLALCFPMKQPYPKPPRKLLCNESTADKLDAIQSYLSSLEYNFIGTQFYAIPKSKPIRRLEVIAQTMIKEALPIKCLEAVILAIYLTRKCVELQRFAISFKSTQGENRYSHVVLGVCCRGRFGAVGLSRRSDLMFKPLKYNKLSELINDFLSAYSDHGHKVVKINISTAIPHTPQFLETINWKGLTFLPITRPDNRWISTVDEYAQIFCISPLTLPCNSFIRSYVTPLPKQGASLSTFQNNVSAVVKRSQSPLRPYWNAARREGAKKTLKRFQNNLPI